MNPAAQFYDEGSEAEREFCRNMVANGLYSEALPRPIELQIERIESESLPRHHFFRLTRWQEQ